MVELQHVAGYYQWEVGGIAISLGRIQARLRLNELLLSGNVLMLFACSMSPNGLSFAFIAGLYGSNSRY